MADIVVNQLEGTEIIYIMSPETSTEVVQYNNPLEIAYFLLLCWNSHAL